MKARYVSSIYPFDAHCVSSARFSGPLDMDLLDISSNLVPYKGLHFLASALSPLESNPGQLQGIPNPVQPSDKKAMSYVRTINQQASRVVDMLLDVLSPSHQLLDIRPKAGT